MPRLLQLVTPTGITAWILACGVIAQSPTGTQRFTAADLYSKRHAGRALLVYERGELVFESYHAGHGVDTGHHIFSGTKSFAPMVALVAQDQGLLSLDETVAKTIHEWRDDPRRKAITIRQLLNFTSGLENLDPLLHSSRSPDKYATSVAAKSRRRPGESFEYGSVHLMVFGELMKRKLTAAHKQSATSGPRDFVGYLQERILTPIGCRFTRWMHDREHNPALPYGAFLTARQWARFGHLVLNRGRSGHRQIIPSQHFAECFRGSKANPIYGLNFWLVGQRYRNIKAIPRDTVAAAGMYKQKLYIVPSRQTIIVRFGAIGTRSRFREPEFLRRLFTAE